MSIYSFFWPVMIEGIRLHTGSLGRSIPTALFEVGRRGPVELRPGFAAAEREWLISTDFSRAVAVLKDRLADPTADAACETLLVAYEVGGTDLGRLLRTLSQFLREDARTRAELQTRQGWTVNAARLALCAPWAVLGMLALRPETVVAYNSATGVLVLAVGQAGYYHSKPRLLLPILLTIIPPAYLAARSRPVAATLGIVAYAAFGLWYGAYMITVWIYTI